MKSIGTTRDFTPDDNGNRLFTMFMITGTAGDVTYVNRGTDVALTNVPTGVWVPCGVASTIKATGTTATGFIVV